MTMKTWQFTAADSLFFGSGKPMNAGESAWIDSQFPPNGFTLQGAVRTAVLYYTDADIEAFKKGEVCLPNGGSLKDEIGDKTHLGKLNLIGPFFSLNDELLFPASLDLMSKKDQHALLKPSDNPITCDLGNIRLPTTDTSGYKVSENVYLSRHDMVKLLNGETNGIHLTLLFAQQPDDTALADKEPKIGLARNNQQRTAIEGMLFAIAPVRLRPQVSLYLQVKGINPEHTPKQNFLQKLGGEGKLASIHVINTELAMPEAPQLTVDKGKIRFKLVFTQPALLPNQGWLPEGFKLSADKTCWQGQLKVGESMIQTTLISACIGKSIKIGGWDLEKHESKPHQAYIPAGSVYFCETEDQDVAKIKQLHNTKLGGNCQYGFGHVLLGRW